MYDQKYMPARTQMNHYLRTGQKTDGFQPDSYNSYDLCELCGGPVYDLDIKGIRDERNVRYQALFQNYETAKCDGKTHKVWQIMGGSTTRQNHRNASGRKVEIDENFRVGGEELFLSNDPEASLSETANCRCSVQYVGGRNKPTRSLERIMRINFKIRYLGEAI